MLLPMGAKGLSPRVWGNHTSHATSVVSMWPIPTCVGQPLFFCFDSCLLKAYPHVCGATGEHVLFYLSKYGLSPRVWGNPGEM